MDAATFWVLLTACLVAASCGFIGVFLILRRLAMVGDAISHAVLPGLVLAFLATHSLGTLPMLAGAVVSGLLASFFIQLLQHGRVQEDASVGATFTAMFALGVVLLSLYAGQVHLDTEHVLFGEIALVPWNTWEVGGRSLGPVAVWRLGGVFLVSLAAVGLWFKEFTICAFDPGLAAAMGIPVALFHYLLMGLVSLTTVAAFDSVGAILAVAMLIVPGATAYLLTDRLVPMLFLSMAAGIFSALTGYAGAALLDVSISGAMAVAAGISFALALLFSPLHGILTRRLERRRWRAA